MRPLLIHQQLRHHHKHGLAMLACITPSGICINHQYIKAIWKEVFEEVIFSSNIIKTRKSSRDGAKKEEREKLQKSLQIKGKLTFWEEKDTSTSKILFDVIPFSPPPSNHFKNPFQNHWENFLNSFWTII
jgi:hypothetical protein